MQVMVRLGPRSTATPAVLEAAFSAAFSNHFPGFGDLSSRRSGHSRRNASRSPLRLRCNYPKGMGSCHNV
jgi:hypothetical protein